MLGGDCAQCNQYGNVNHASVIQKCVPHLKDIEFVFWAHFGSMVGLCCKLCLSVILEGCVEMRRRLRAVGELVLESLYCVRHVAWYGKVNATVLVIQSKVSPR